MKRHFLPFAAFLLAFVPAAASASGIAALTDPAQHFNGEVVTVHGSVTNFHEAPSRYGGAFATFSVCADACVRVYAQGNPHIDNGQGVTVTGTFAAVDRIGGFVYYNQIETTELQIHSGNPTAPSHK